ncbi:MULTISPECIES: hypothetical protein [unclassified Microbacterium]|uniref:hypothetical protein n=1 Tax=unclassified Microbacterium TaxID=2609290 RepID=UPI001E29270B|nr:hypothetical protein [Microbacterium sp. MAH-37]
MEENTTGGGLDRRTIIKGAAWSLPVVAVAAAVPAMAASTDTDLVPALSGPITLTLSALGISVATISVVNTLTITNNGPAPTPATGTQATVQYDPALLTLNIAAVAGVVVGGTDGNRTLSLPSIPAGGSLTIGLGSTLDSLLTLSVLTGILGGGTPQMTATVTGDSVTGNNSTAEDIGVTIL